MVGTTALADKGGLPACLTNLAVCNTKLDQATKWLPACLRRLATCKAQLDQAQKFPATGQTRSFYPDDDGAIPAGAPLSYTDTGRGTIIDNNTKLEWEKKSDDEAENDGDNTTFPHDKDNVYTWEQAFEHVAYLNAMNFAGHHDWRLPNVKELQSIVDYSRVQPAVSPEFKTPCTANSTVLSGSCTTWGTNTWSSTSVNNDPMLAWYVAFWYGDVGGSPKGGPPYLYAVRAVRGGT